MTSPAYLQAYDKKVRTAAEVAYEATRLAMDSTQPGFDSCSGSSRV